MTNQEAFNKVWQHFIVDGNPPGWSDNDDACCYRGDNGSRCAVGCLIPDELYSQPFGSIEGMALSSIHYTERFRSLFADVSFVFLEDLQKAHDTTCSNEKGDPRYGFIARFERELIDIAAHYGLEVPNNGL